MNQTHAVEERLNQIMPKVERAKQHIAELEYEVRKFLATTPYKLATKRDSQRKLVYYLHSLEPVPLKLSLISGDIIQNLRTALDHLAYQLVMVGANDNPPNAQKVYFPIADNAERYETKKAQDLQGAHDEAIKVVDEIKPYKNGNTLLWQLHKLNNIEKHRLLITVGSKFSGVNIGQYMHDMMQKQNPELFSGMPVINMFLNAKEEAVPLKVGDTLFTGAVDDAVNEKMQFRFELNLYEPEIIETAPLVTIAHQFVQAVEQTVNALKPHLTSRKIPLPKGSG